jgi:broad specificity phosphatase PhoE
LIRHGQAGPRDNYDQLSELGQLQARLLGEYLVAQKIELTAIYAGALNRQQQTARIASEQIAESNQSAPEIIVEEKWNEFSLATVYRGLASRLIAESVGFACDYEEMQAALMADPHTTRGAAGRCDRAVIEAWMQNRYPDYDGESWPDFRARVQSNLDRLAKHDSNDNIMIHTSATPIAIWVGTALGLPHEKILRLMAVLYNSSLTTIKIREEELLLLNFNMTPHLTDSSLITFR